MWLQFWRVDLKIIKTNQKPFNYLEDQHTNMFWHTNRQAHSVLLFYIDHISSNHLNLGCCTTAGAFDKAALLIKWLSALIHQVGLENTNWKFAPNIHYVLFYFQAFKCFSWVHSTNGVTLEYNRKPDKPRRTTQYRLPMIKTQFSILFR